MDGHVTYGSPHIAGFPLNNSFRTEYLKGSMSFMVPQKQELNKWEMVLKMGK